MFILLLSAFIVFAFIFERYAPNDTEVIRYLHWGDTLTCVFFLIDVLWRWLASPHKLKFWLWGWIDLLASIPNLNWLRLGRLVRAFQIFYLLRTLRSGARILQYLFSDRLKGTMAFVATMLTGSILLGGLLVLKFESQTPEANIRTAYDALWWCINTITTVGSGDTYPITDAGRAVGIVLMFVGISLFSTLSALLANWLLRGSRHRLPATAASSRAADSNPHLLAQATQKAPELPPSEKSPGQ